MPLITRNENELLAEVRQHLLENTSVTSFSPGGTARAIAEVASRHMAEQITILNSNILQAFVSRATGEFLDRIGELLGVSRLAATYAADTSRNNFRFSIDPSTGLVAQDLARVALAQAQRTGIPQTTLTASSFRIRQGTPLGIRSATAFLYVTTEDVIFSGEATEAFAGVIALGLGASFNIGANALTRHGIAERQPELTPIAENILCTNLQAVTSGQGLESDQDLRFRITQAAVAAASSNETAVRLAVLSVPGVNDILVKNYARGVGTFNIFIVGDTAIVPEGVLRAAQAAVNSVQAVGIRGLVQAPDYLGLEISTRLKFVLGTTIDERRTIRTDSLRSLVDYVNNIPPGGQFILNELIQRILQTSDRILDMETTRMAAGIYNTSLGANTKVLPIIPTNQQAHWDEKWYTNASLSKVFE